ncbi:hypothetical protein DRJ25_04440 [Candidatus Woesearchaeota archaeon]|nr:MAG: hypothetical protein DRJ25_04440 [Candidatus Woesearchaeota archaeon]
MKNINLKNCEALHVMSVSQKIWDDATGPDFWHGKSPDLPNTMLFVNYYCPDKKWAVVSDSGHLSRLTKKPVANYKRISWRTWNKAMLKKFAKKGWDNYPRLVFGESSPIGIDEKGRVVEEWKIIDVI